MDKLVNLEQYVSSERKMPTTEQWRLISDKIAEVTRLIQQSGLTSVSAIFKTDDEINNWEFKIKALQSFSSVMENEK